MRGVGVVGHTEWVDFAVVGRLPRAGDIVEAREAFAEPGGGAGVAAVNLARIAGVCTFLTAVGDDALGEHTTQAFRARGVDVHAAVRAGTPQRRAFTHLSEDDGERTITVVGEPVVPQGADPLPWDAVGGLGGVYVTAGDADAVRAARAARVLVAAARAADVLKAAAVPIDVLVASASDEVERAAAARLGGLARRVLLTRGARGGTWTAEDGTTGAWAAEPLPGPPVDAFGCGDTFAASLALALGEGLALDEALRFAARCGGAVLTGRGPYGAPLPAWPGR